MYKQLLLIVFALSIVTFGFSQNVTIKGNAPSYKGDNFIFKTYSDLITYTEKELNRTKVDDNGNFSISFKIDETITAFISLGGNKGFINLEPGQTYEIKLPIKTEKTTEEFLNPYFKESEFYIGINNLQKQDLNRLTIEFDDVFNSYFSLNYVNLLRNPQKSKIDSAILLINNRFAGVSNKYFDNYRKYHYASLKHLSYERKDVYVTKKYFTGQDILYNNTAYMKLFNELFTNYFTSYSETPEGEYLSYFLVVKKSLSDVKATLPKAINDEKLKELIILKGIFDGYFASDFPKEPFITILDSLILTTKIPEHKTAGRNMKKKIMKLRPGSGAPQFVLADKSKNSIALSQFEGKFVYLNFCTSISFACQQQMELLKKLHENYNEIIEIVTISVDKDFNNMLEYCNERDYNWTILDFAKQPNILDVYRVKAFPTYYLIDPAGNIALSPAPNPDQNFNSIFESQWKQYKPKDLKNNDPKDNGDFKR